MRPLPVPDAGRAWLHRHPPALDLALAAGVLAAMVAGSFPDTRNGQDHLGATHTPSTLGLVLMVLAAAALVPRRRAPRAVLAATGGLALLELAADQHRAPVAMSAVVALYTVAAATDRPTTWRLGLLTGSVLTTAGMLAGPWPWYAQDNIGLFAWTGMAAAAGDAVRSRRAYVRAMRERAERAELTREEEARRRVAEERLRIARDLHDVVAHHIALVNVQAGVAAHVMDRRPDQAKQALAHVREAGRTALGELRSTVGLLRQSGEPEAPTEPAPGLGRLGDLLETFRRAGLPVTVTLPPGPEDLELPVAVDLAAYRIIQEALTNVRKHAGAGASAEVSVVRASRRLELTVLDTGPHDGDVPRGADEGDEAGETSERDGADETDEADEPDEAGGADEDDGAQEPDPGPRPRDAAPGSPTSASVPTPASVPIPTLPDEGVPGTGGGHGLVGMRERAAALGGSCTAGPRSGGGFRVRAILPIGATDRARRAMGERT